MILVLSYWDLSNPTSGGARRVAALLAVLGKQAVLVQPRVHHPLYTTCPFPADLGRRKVGINWGIFNFLLPSTRRVTRGLIRNQSPKAVLLTSMWTYFPLKAFPRLPKVLDAHDVNATAIAERYGAGHPFTRLVRAVEKKVVHSVDHVFVCSEQDRDQYIRMYGLSTDRISVVPNGVDAAAFETGDGQLPDSLADQLRDHCVLFFMGKLDYQPNAEGLQFLDQELMPALEKHAPGRFKMLITGGPVPREPFHPSILFAGRLPDADLREAIRRADICLAPVFSGSGTRLKVLEYMAAGKPVVSTVKGAEGIEVPAGKAIAIAKRDEFFSRIMDLAENPESAGRIGQQARETVRAKYDWKQSIQPRWRAVLQRWIELEP